MTGPVRRRSATIPRLLAARAEALCLRSRWKEAAEQYRQAIERVDNDLIRRSWWFNLADVAQRLNDEGQRQAAFRAVLAVHNSDDISPPRQPDPAIGRSPVADTRKLSDSADRAELTGRPDNERDSQVPPVSPAQVKEHSTWRHSPRRLHSHPRTTPSPGTWRTLFRRSLAKPGDRPTLAGRLGLHGAVPAALPRCPVAFLLRVDDRRELQPRVPRAR